MTTDPISRAQEHFFFFFLSTSLIPHVLSSEGICYVNSCDNKRLIMDEACPHHDGINIREREHMYISS